MKIINVNDLQTVCGYMHDSIFREEDFGFDPQKKKFHLKSRCCETGREFYLELLNVETYNPVNLDKIIKEKATGGVFNTIRIKQKGLKLIILSQDLHIKLQLSKLTGEFRMVDLSQGDN